MRSNWETIRWGLLQWIESREAVRVFDRLATGAPELGAFSRPAVLVEAVAKTADLGMKDRVLAALIVAAGAKETRRLAQALLMLCLWPGLDAMFHRRFVFFRREPQELAAEIVDHFTVCVQRLDLSRVTRITATLVRNTERELVDASRKESAVTKKAAELCPEMYQAREADFRRSPFGVPCGRWDQRSVATLRAWLASAVGKDADLVIEAVLLDRSGDELARSLGSSPAAARKRLERALVRARCAFFDEGQSQTAAVARFC